VATEEKPIETSYGGFILAMIRMFILPFAVLLMLFNHFKSSVGLKMEESMI